MIDAIPADPRTQFAEHVLGIAARQHLENGLQGRPRELLIAIGLTNETVEVVDRPIVTGHCGHYLLCQNIETVAWCVSWLDVTVHHPARHGGSIQNVLAMGDIDTPHASLPHQVTGSPHSLQPSGDTARRLQLNDGIYLANVDAQFQRTGGHQSGQLAGLE